MGLTGARPLRREARRQRQQEALGTSHTKPPFGRPSAQACTQARTAVQAGAEEQCGRWGAAHSHRGRGEPQREGRGGIRSAGAPPAEPLLCEGPLLSECVHVPPARLPACLPACPPACLPGLGTDARMRTHLLARGGGRRQRVREAARGHHLRGQQAC